MSQLLQLRDAVVAATKTALPTFEVEGHLGRFAANDLATFLTRAPAVRVAVLNLGDSRATGETGEDIDAVATLGVYVVTKDVGGRLTRDVAALAAVERLCLLATGNRWGLNFTRAADAPTASNLFSDATLKSGVALWAIELKQPVRLWFGQRDGETPAPEPAELTELFVGIAPKTGAAHLADYIGPFTNEGGHD